MTDELKQQHSADAEELKVLIEDAAKLLGLTYQTYVNGKCYSHLGTLIFNPLAPGRGDLMRMAEAAELLIDHQDRCVCPPSYVDADVQYYEKGDHPSLALAILRAASVVLRSKELAKAQSRGGV